MSNGDVITWARQLLAAEWRWDEIYSRLDSVLARESQDRVGELLVALVDLVVAPVRPSATWIFDLFPHVPHAVLEALAVRERVARSLGGLGATAPELLMVHAESLIDSALLEELPIGVGARVLDELTVDRLVELGSHDNDRPGIANRARLQLVDRWFRGDIGSDELALLDPLLSENELLEVGADPEGDAVRILGASTAWVMRFPDEVRLLGARSSHASFARRWHPTWVPASGRHAARSRFGGRGTALASGQSLAHLLTLDLRASGFDSRRHARVAFEMPRWVPFGDRPSYVRHARDGHPLELIGENPGELHVLTDDFLSTDVDLVEVAPPYWLPDWGAANHRDNLHRVGGRPAFIQAPEYPRCPGCGLRMPFVFQLGDGTPCDERTATIDEGLVYAFFCDSCGVSAYLHQST